jgi:hypothetical protein
VFIAAKPRRETSGEPVMANAPQSDPNDIAEQVRQACIQEAIRAYEDAGISGLCHAGRFEAAISAVRMLDLSALLD